VPPQRAYQLDGGACEISCRLRPDLTELLPSRWHRGRRSRACLDQRLGSEWPGATRRWFNTQNVVHWHGCQELVIAFLDERLAKAFSHRLRLRILQRLSEHGTASPSELADELGEPLANISYHVRILRELDCVELARTEPRRGAVEHFYRATVRPWLTDEQWAQLPATFRHRTLARTLSAILESASTAGRQGAFDGPEACVSRVALAVDETGSTEITALLTDTLKATLRINAASASRQAERASDAPQPLATELAVIHLRQADTV
jgi:DNA-binding transcriptional ArsR family regulator